MTLQRIISYCLFLASMLLALTVHAELSESEQDIFSNESPLARPLLARALALEKNTSALDSEWQAAVAYCEASRLGSAEGQHRPGHVVRIWQRCARRSRIGGFAILFGQLARAL